MCGCLNLTVNITNNGWNFSSWMKTINITNALDRPLKKLIVMSTHFQTQIYYIPPANKAGLVDIFNVLTKSTDRAESTVKKERWSNASTVNHLASADPTHNLRKRSTSIFTRFKRQWNVLELFKTILNRVLSRLSSNVCWFANLLFAKI